MADHHSISEKFCASCRTFKPVAEFSKKARNKDGLQDSCKRCVNSYNADYYARNKSAIKSRQKSIYTRKKKMILEKNRSWRKRNAEAVRLAVLRYASNNRDKLREARKLWEVRNKKKLSSYKREHYESNRMYYIQKSAEYRTHNTEKVAEMMRNARARRRCASGTHTATDIKRLHHLQRGKCACCRLPLKKYHVDHRMPLALGGSNGPENLQLLCPSCNLKKSAKHPIDYMQEQGFLL